MLAISFGKRNLSLRNSFPCKCKSYYCNGETLDHERLIIAKVKAVRRFYQTFVQYYLIG